jgi:hypothetical protein
MLARTAADEHGIAEIANMSRRARAVSSALREPGRAQSRTDGPQLP